MKNSDMHSTGGVDFHRFVDDELLVNGFRVCRITNEYMIARLDDIMSLVNGTRTEYASSYGWNVEPREYFLNGLDRKWDFSFAVEAISTGTLCFVSLSSVYGDILHIHCAYAAGKYRGASLGKLLNIKLCQAGLDAGFSRIEGYWPKQNNGSIILFLRMGWHIEDLRKQGTQLLLVADLMKARNQTYHLLVKERGSL
jgi:hypothetical protein